MQDHAGLRLDVQYLQLGECPRCQEEPPLDWEVNDYDPRVAVAPDPQDEAITNEVLLVEERARLWKTVLDGECVCCVEEFRLIIHQSRPASYKVYNTYKS